MAIGILLLALKLLVTKIKKLKHTSGKKKGFVPIRFIERRNDNTFGCGRVDEGNLTAVLDIVNYANVRYG